MSLRHPHRPDYRPDIDGLRALAVLAVVVFHALPALLPGGFVGVDLFFVISGYLITGIVVRGSDAGRFGLLEFYARRARRIFPALALVLVATMALGALVLPAHENTALGRHVVAGALFASNLLLWREAGYFDAASATKPLLHLWSLGIEEQFYLLWPVVLLLLARVRRYRIAATALLALASLALNVATVPGDAAAGFYSPAQRAWELLAGALLALQSRDGRVALPARWRHAASMLGLLLVSAAILAFTPATPFPGWTALLPVTGAVLLVAAGEDAWINRRLLAHPALVSVGLVSFPLYLWHWPLLVLARRAHGAEAGTLTVMIAAGVSIAAACATYRLLELPIRRPALMATAPRAAIALGITAMLGGVVAISRADFDRDALVAEAARNDWETPNGIRAVYYASSARRDPDVVFLGDSHTEQYFPAVKRALAAQPSPATVAFSTHGGCPVLPAFDPAVCGAVYARAMALAARPSVRRVVIASAWDIYHADSVARRGYRMSPARMAEHFAGLADDVARLRAAGKEVVLIGPHPHSPLADPELLAAHTRIGRLGTRAPTRFASSFPLEAFKVRTAFVDDMLRRVSVRTGASLVDPSEVLCPRRECFTTDERGVPVRKDADHLRPFAAVRYLAYVPALVRVPARDAMGGAR